MNVWLPGDMCVYVDVMRGRSCSSMLQNDLLLIEKGKKAHGQRQAKWGDEEVHWFYFIEGQKIKQQEGGWMDGWRGDKEGAICPKGLSKRQR